MYKCLNQVTLVGYVNKDPLVKLKNDTANKKSHVYISLGIRNKQSWQNVSNLVAFDEIAERIAQCQVKRSDHLLVTGYLTSNSVTDKQTGETRYNDNVVITNFSKLNKSQQDETDDLAENETQTPQSD